MTPEREEVIRRLAGGSTFGSKSARGAMRELLAEIDRLRAEAKLTYGFHDVGDLYDDPKDELNAAGGE